MGPGFLVSTILSPEWNPPEQLQQTSATAFCFSDAVKGHPPGCPGTLVP